MRYFDHYEHLKFYKEPMCFTKYTKKETLQWAIGANMYMPGTQQNIYDKLLNNTYKEIGAITFCLEDAIPVYDVEVGENNIINILEGLFDKEQEMKKKGISLLKRLPLIFVRVRNTTQFRNFAKKLSKKSLHMLTGFNFPKFNSTNGCEYFNILKELSDQYHEILYGMPILEDKSIIYQESRISELLRIQKILVAFDSYVLGLRVGGTDFSSIFGLRRDIDYSIWDIRPISDCLADIINIFMRSEYGYVISGPVWEYFSNNKNSKEILGLKRELDLDSQNGLQGKTIIHPSQIDIVNQSYIVDYASYQDANKLLSMADDAGGVFKSINGNRMNEVNPHFNWAKKVIAKATIFGVAERV